MGSIDEQGLQRIKLDAGKGEKIIIDIENNGHKIGQGILTCPELKYFLDEDSADFTMTAKYFLKKKEEMKKFKFPLAVSNYDQDLIDWCVGIGYNNNCMNLTDKRPSILYNAWNENSYNPGTLGNFNSDAINSFEYIIDYKDNPELTKALLAAVNDEKSNDLEYLFNEDGDIYRCALEWNGMIKPNKPTLTELLDHFNCKLSGKRMVGKSKKIEHKDIVTIEFVEKLKKSLMQKIESEIDKIFDKGNPYERFSSFDEFLKHNEQEDRKLKDVKIKDQNVCKCIWHESNVSKKVLVKECDDCKEIRIMAKEHLKHLERLEKDANIIQDEFYVINKEYKKLQSYLSKNEAEQEKPYREHIERLEREKKRITAKIDRISKDRGYDNSKKISDYSGVKHLEQNDYLYNSYHENRISLIENQEFIYNGAVMKFNGKMNLEFVKYIPANFSTKTILNKSAKNSIDHLNVSLEKERKKVTAKINKPTKEVVELRKLIKKIDSLKVDNLTEGQVSCIVDWLNSWSQIRGGAIPVRFKESFGNNNYNNEK